MAADEAVDRLRLGLGVRPGAAVGEVARIRRRALVVVAPLVGHVAVQVDAVGVRDLAVAVVVAEVLAPQALALVEREVVAVGVRDRHEVELALVDEAADLRVARVVLLEDVVLEPADHLWRDPLAGVLGAEVEDARLLAVALIGVLGDLQHEDVGAVDRLADVDELRDAPVLARRLLEVLLQAVRAEVLAKHLVSLGGERGGALGDGLAVDLLGPQDDAVLAQRGDLPAVEHGLQMHLSGPGLADPQVPLVTVEAEIVERTDGTAVDGPRVDVELAIRRLRRGGAGQNDERRDERG